MKVAVLASGEGTNLQALIDRAHGHDGVELVAFATDKPGSRAQERAQAAGIASHVFAGEQFGGDRAARDLAIADWLGGHGVELVVLAGYMQLVDPGFLERFPERVINVHPALLPAFPGIGAVRKALDYGVKVFGVTVHFVDEGMDTGPVIFQRALELPAAQDVDEVRAALRPIEHELLVEAVRLIARGQVRLDGANRRRVVISR